MRGFSSGLLESSAAQNPVCSRRPGQHPLANNGKINHDIGKGTTYANDTRELTWLKYLASKICIPEDM